jgi:hypothetical protein
VTAGIGPDAKVGDDMGCEEFRDQLMDALYGEAGEDARAFDAHRRACAACDDELRALRSLRGDLAAWKIPRAPGVAPGMARSVRLPMALAASVLLAIAGPLVIAGTEVTVADGGLVVRIGRPEDGVAAALRAQEERHRAVMAQLQGRLDGAPRGEGAGLEEVRRLIRESEARQAVLFDAGLRQLAERTDAQRREDMAQMSAGLSYVEGRTGLQVARTTELMGQVLQASRRK